MRVAIVNTFDLFGGAARAAYRLHRSLLDAAIDSNMVVQTKQGDDVSVLGPSDKLHKVLGRVRPAADALPLALYRARTPGTFSPAWLPSGRVLSAIADLAPDVIHLHWVAGGMLNIEELASLRRPIVWSLHDMWPFTGGCHYDGECGRYRSRCHGCPALGSTAVFDLSSLGQWRKARAYAKLENLTIVGVSRWLCECANRSAVLRGRPIRNLPNPLDTTRFRPVEKGVARGILGLPDSKKLILFAAPNPRDPRKGFRELHGALATVVRADVELLVLGSGRPHDAPSPKYPVHYLGDVRDDVTLQLIYSAADLLVVPSLQENLSNAIMEGLSCGTPVVAFAIGGNVDMVDHVTTGYLAVPYDLVDLARGIEWVCSHPEPAKLSERAREKVLREFDSGVVAQKYIALYKELVRSPLSVP